MSRNDLDGFEAGNFVSLIARSFVFILRRERSRA